ncbi:MAG: YgaP family membrane protein [Bacillota bacterium]
MKKNVGDLDAMLRIWGGLFLLASGINRDSEMMMALGAGKVAEGITRFCPMLYYLGLSTREENSPTVREERRSATPQVQVEQ